MLFLVEKVKAKAGTEILTLYIIDLPAPLLSVNEFFYFLNKLCETPCVSYFQTCHRRFLPI